MRRLIDANEVVKAILAERDKIPRTIRGAPYELGVEKPFHAGDQMRGGIRKALRCIEQATTVDAVPVVRCGECKHLGFCGDATNLEVMGFYGYCSRGERKEGADNGS